jgi:flagellar hook-associated protein FlgK
MSTGIYMDGAVQEDLLVFVSAGSGTITGSYDASMADPAALNTKRIDALRAEKYDVTFTSEKQYQITWRNPSTGVKTVLAEREYDPKQGIEYRGVHLMLNRPPVSGDTFLIDGNQDGTGNNQNMLDIVALQTKGVVGGNGGRTISQAYEEQLGRVGNFASQAKIAQDALKVVNDQAIEARDKVSGVSLDSEAADLIRFQQAYQASAKAMQVSGDLFDAILQAAR